MRVKSRARPKNSRHSTVAMTPPRTKSTSMLRWHRSRPASIPVAMPHRLGEKDTHLAHMVGAEGGGHGDALGFAEGVILHGADEIDHHLGDGKGGAFGKQAQENNGHHFHQNKEGIPTHPAQLFHGGGSGLGQNGPQEIGAHGDEKIKGMPPLGPPQSHGKENEVGGLGIAEHPAADGIGKSAKKAAYSHQNSKDPKSLGLHFGGVGFVQLIFFMESSFACVRERDQALPK